MPLENSAQDHQRKNAYEYAATRACNVVEENNLTPHILFAEIKKVLRESDAYEKNGRSGTALRQN